MRRKKATGDGVYVTEDHRWRKCEKIRENEVICYPGFPFFPLFGFLFLDFVQCDEREMPALRKTAARRPSSSEVASGQETGQSRRYALEYY